MKNPVVIFGDGLQRRIADFGRKRAEQRPHVAVLGEADVRAAVIFLRRQVQHHADEPDGAGRERRALFADAAGDPLHGKAQDGSDFGAHASTPNRSASTLLWKARQNQPEKALMGSMLRPSAYSRAAEIQIAAPFRLAKISHQ